MPKAYLPEQLLEKISAVQIDQLQRLKVFFEFLYNLRNNLTQEMCSNPRIPDVIASPDFTWSQDYNTDIKERARLRLASIGEEGKFHAINDHPADQQFGVMLSMMESMMRQPPIETPQMASRRPEMLGWGQAGIKMLDSLLIYGVPIHAMLLAAHHGNDGWLCKAVSIDRAALEIPEIAARIRRAETRRAPEDESFLANLRKVMKGPSGYIGLDHPLLRPMLWITSTSGLLDQLGYQDRHELFINQLEVYPGDGADPADALDGFIDRWKKSVADINLKFAS